MPSFFATLLALLVLLAPALAAAKEATTVAPDPVLEKRVLTLSEELRCLVCQNQTIAESHAGLAIDLKNQIREQMSAGKSDADILEYMVARYGDFVLYRPPVKASTVLLWFGPFALLAGAIGFLLIQIKRRRTTLQQSNRELTDAERSRAQQLLDDARTGEPQ
jgi:cytochrome c-type biogenesis protein CcmH